MLPICCHAKSTPRTNYHIFKEKMVRSEGIEPPTCRLGGGRSIRLSYERIKNEYSIRCAFFLQI